MGVVCALLNNMKVDAYIKNCKRKTALDVALQRRDDNVARLLEVHLTHQRHRKQHRWCRRNDDAERTQALEVKHCRQVPPREDKEAVEHFLIWASGFGKVSLVRVFVNECWVDINTIGYHGKTALILAS